jgi:imidazolonepropionase
MEKLLIYNIGILQTPMGSSPLKGTAQAENLKLYNASILITDGVIKEITSDGKMPDGLTPDTAKIDAGGKLVTPGLIDSHTHLVFGGWRQNEIPLKIKGASYLDILRAGGGILDTVGKTRIATEEELFEKSKTFLDEMLALGVTTCEAKSGYGLDIETELKQLNVIKKLDETHPIDVIATFMGAHAIPKEYSDNPNGYIDFVCEELLPIIADKGLALYCDIFCEDSVFDVSQSRKLLLKAKELGFGIKIHADEIEEIGGAELGGEVSAISAEHLIATGEKGIKAMSEAGVIANLLPQTSFYLGKNYAPARDMINEGIAVSIASDFNPGSCPSNNLQLAINLGYLKYRLFPEEILTAVTLNAACTIGVADKAGTIEVGKNADIVIWNTPDFETVCYRFGVNQAKTVIKGGKIEWNLYQQ